MLYLYYSNLSLSSLMLFTENNTKSTFPVTMYSFFSFVFEKLKNGFIYRPNRFSHGLQVHPIVSSMLNFKNPPTILQTLPPHLLTYILLILYATRQYCLRFYFSISLTLIPLSSVFFPS